MNNAKTPHAPKTKQKLWIKFYPERWLFGSTRDEMTNAERAVWFDFLALAALNDPPGQFEFIVLRRLANQLNISMKLLKSAIDKALRYRKVQIEKKIMDPKLKEINKNSLSIGDRSVTNSEDLVTSQSKYGLALHIVKILNWEKYQSEYMRQKPYRAQSKDCDRDDISELQESAVEIVTQVTDRGEEMRKDENREEETREEGTHADAPISNDKKYFLTFLQEFSEGFQYPFDKGLDSQIYDYCMERFPKVDPVRELEKKVEYWKENPGSLMSKGKGPREQLMEFFQMEEDYQKG